MNKILIVIALFILIVGGGLYLLHKKQTQMMPASTTVTNPPSETTPVVNQSPQNANVNVDESKNQISLNVLQPTDGQVVSSPSITVRGSTVPNGDVSVNDTDLKADAQGNFSASISLNEGDNTIAIVAVDSTGQSAEKDFTVTYNSGQQYN